MREEDKNFNKKEVSLMTYCDRDYDYPSVYRYVRIDEFKTIMLDKRLKFTNIDRWKKTDSKETFYDNYFHDVDNISKLADKIFNEEYYPQISKEYDCIKDTQRINYYDFIKVFAMFQWPKHALCFASIFDDEKMLLEYNKKYCRNIIMKFNREWYKNISGLGKYIDGESIILKGEHVSIDYFPMHYIDDYETFMDELEKLSCDFTNKTKFENLLFNKGEFLKDKNFNYENEIRAINHFNSNSYELVKQKIQEFGQGLFARKVDAKEEGFKIIDYSRKIAEKITPNDFEFLSIPNGKNISDIIDEVYVWRNSSDEKEVREICESLNIKVTLINI
ncbi:hypothetical protein [Chryseobacterium sp.]|uniref:hypothetical protein n=1 Tax=Chryseobacterium sp. TaxID=1871047 RepID=UPI002FCA6B60